MRTMFFLSLDLKYIWFSTKSSPLLKSRESSLSGKSTDLRIREVAPHPSSDTIGCATLDKSLNYSEPQPILFFSANNTVLFACQGVCEGQIRGILMKTLWKL